MYRPKGPVFITDRKITKAEHIKMVRQAKLNAFKFRAAMRASMRIVEHS